MNSSTPPLRHPLIAALRPAQWTKNAVVLAAFIFALGDRTQQVPLTNLWRVIAAAILFCTTSSGIYLINDVRDADLDRAHPIKRLRPVAAGLLPPATAVTFAVLLIAGSMAASLYVNRALTAVLAAYVLLQILYIFAMKNVALVDLLVIAFGFVLRATAGAVAVSVGISPWLLLCTFWLALFLAVCKRRHEKIELNHLPGATRPALEKYDPRLLDQLIAVISAVTVVSYSLYTLWPDTVAKFGTHLLGLTIPFVVFGIFRYLDLVYRHAKGDRPERILLSDGPILVNLFLYGLSILAIVMFLRFR